MLFTARTREELRVNFIFHLPQLAARQQSTCASDCSVFFLPSEDVFVFPLFFFFFGKDTLQVGSHISCFSASGHYFAEGVEERLL